MKKNTIKNILIWIAGLIIAVYLVSMIVIPVYKSGTDWQAIQKIWVRWQGLNVGMLAFAASVFVYGAARYKASEERKRNFTAARAFLPDAFSGLSRYCRGSMALFADAWSVANDPDNKGRFSPNATMPDLPERYREVFGDCIKSAEPEVGTYLALILAQLQVHHSRMSKLFEGTGPTKSSNTYLENIIAYLYGIAKIQALINKNFQYARGETPDFDDSPLEYENYESALSDGGINIDVYDDLQGFIERELARR